MSRGTSLFIVGFAALLPPVSAGCAAPVCPGAAWESRSPAQLGMDPAPLDAIRDYLGGRGCIVRGGYMVYTWGDQALRSDVASACKPWFSHFLFKAVEDGRLPGLDTKAVAYAPCLNGLNADLGFKDRDITFRHLATQTSCYGVREAPGAAFDYNDWQMALFWDTLFKKVYGATDDNVDARVLHPLLTDRLQCQDRPTMTAFGANRRPGRVAVSVRDFARFGLLYARRGEWNGAALISRAHATAAVSSPLPLSIPRTAGESAEMCPGQRSLGSEAIPDDQADHDGSYSWLWWVNGVRRNGRRFFPDAPADAFAALGHKHGMRGVAGIPRWDVIIAWNDTTLGHRPGDPHPLNEVFRLLRTALARPPAGR